MSWVKNAFPQLSKNARFKIAFWNCHALKRSIPGPFQLITGMMLGYVPAIALAVWGAGFIAGVTPVEVLKWVIALTFIVFGVFILKSKGEEEKDSPNGLLALKD